MTATKLRAVWRIEHAVRQQGPFSGGHAYDSIVQAMPVVRGYGWANGVREEDVDYRYGWRFAFSSLRALRRWVRPSLMADWRKYGYVLRKYTVRADAVLVASEPAPAYVNDAYPKAVNAVFDPTAVVASDTRKLEPRFPRCYDCPAPDGKPIKESW